jgi:hypothetical protein
MNTRKQNERLDRMSEALFGAPENIELVDAVEDLKTVGIEPEELCSRMYERLCVEAQAYRMRRENVPPLLKKALESLRPNTAPPRTQMELDRRASSTVSQILDAVKARFILPSNTLSGLTLSTAFRNKELEKSTKDQQIIDRLENELLSDLENEEKEDAD